MEPSGVNNLYRNNGAIPIGVIGVGHLGTIHARLLKSTVGADLRGIYDSDRDRAEALASELDIRCYNDIDELLSDCEVVTVVTPTSTHEEVARRALEAGVHTFIEKPITATYAEAEGLLALADERGLLVQVGHIERFNPVFAALGDVVLAPMFIEAHRLAQFRPRATDVAVVLDLMIHDIDLVLTLVDSSPTEIRSSGVSVVSDAVDIANARLEFANGCVANLTASRISQRPMRKMRIFQPDAYISIDFAAPSAEVFRIGEGEESGTILLGEIERGTQPKKIFYNKPTIPESNALATELQAFIDAVRDGTTPKVTGHSAAEALRIAETIVNQIERR